MDADACPKPVREVVFRAAARLALEVRVVACVSVPAPYSEHVKAVLVPTAPNSADDYIVAALAPGDLVVSDDIPLAHAAIKRGAWVIEPRGTLFTDDNIGERSAVRDLLHDLRESGERLGGPAPFGPKDKQRFADTFDRALNKLLRSRPAPPRP
jgi:uncharacterized protein YaiI (UPF0178 family)